MYVPPPYSTCVHACVPRLVLAWECVACVCGLARGMVQRSWEDKLAEAHELARRREAELSKVGITLNSAMDKELMALKAREVRGCTLLRARALLTRRCRLWPRRNLVENAPLCCTKPPLRALHTVPLRLCFSVCYGLA
jgi:hypothetical protein